MVRGSSIARDIKNIKNIARNDGRECNMVI